MQVPPAEAESNKMAAAAGDKNPGIENDDESEEIETKNDDPQKSKTNDLTQKVDNGEFLSQSWLYSFSILQISWIFVKICYDLCIQINNLSVLWNKELDERADGGAAGGEQSYESSGIEPPSSSFVLYFVLGSIFVVGGYIGYNRRKKVIAILTMTLFY